MKMWHLLAIMLSPLLPPLLLVVIADLLPTPRRPA